MLSKRLFGNNKYMDTMPVKADPMAGWKDVKRFN